MNLKAYDILGLVHYIVYMIDLIAEVYGVKLMRVLSSCVLRHMDFERVIPLDMGMDPLLDCSMLNVTPQKYPSIFIIKIIIYFGYKLSQLGYFPGTDK